MTIDLGTLRGAPAADRRAAYVAARQRLNREAAERGPADLADYLDPHYVRRPHTDVMSAALEEVAAGRDRYVLITCPPQVGKTVTAIVWAAFWILVRDPRQRIIIVSYSAALAAERGREIRKLIRSYGRRYGLDLERGSSSVTDWRVTAGGGVLSTGIGGGITGRPGTIILLDDLLKSRKEADSLTYRNMAWDALSADVWTRRAPGAPVIYTTTLWHPDDPAGRFLKRDGDARDGGLWRVIRMPAICTDPDTDALGRARGEPLTHPRLAADDRAGALAHWRESERGVIARDWWALYQCDPRPVEGALVTQEMIDARRELRPTAKPRRTGVGVDPSGDGRDTCGIVGGYLATDGGLYVTHDRTDVLTTLEWPERACLLAAETDADVIVIEANYGGGMGERILATAWRDLTTAGRIPAGRRRPRIVKAWAKKSKALRAEDVVVDIQTKRVWFADVFPGLEYELCTWRPGDTDSPGAIDAFVHLAHELLPDIARAPGKTVATAAGLSRSAVAGRTGLPPGRIRRNR